MYKFRTLLYIYASLCIVSSCDTPPPSELHVSVIERITNDQLLVTLDDDTLSYGGDYDGMVGSGLLVCRSDSNRIEVVYGACTYVTGVGLLLIQLK